MSALISRRFRRAASDTNGEAIGVRQDKNKEEWRGRGPGIRLLISFILSILFILSDIIT